MSRYSITVEFEADTVEEAVSLVAVGDIVELLNLDLRENNMSVDAAEFSRKQRSRRLAELGISDSEGPR